MIRLFTVRPIGYVRSTLTHRDDAPKQGDEGAPSAWLELDADVAPGLADLRAGESVLLPNPIGIHRVHLVEIASPTRLRVAALEAIDGTPILDIKPLLGDLADR